MSQPPERPKIYHITHVDNLTRTVADSVLMSDAKLREHRGPAQIIGMSEIKRRRIEVLPVHLHPGTMVGDYVPFYFCPRSIMLYVIHCANQPELGYRDGQGLIVHLEADLRSSIEWAEARNRRWAFSLSNAGAFYTQFRSSVQELDQLSWDAIAARDFRSPQVKEIKQAEFLMHEIFPLELIERVGVISDEVRGRTSDALSALAVKPKVEMMREWYF